MKLKKFKFPNNFKQILAFCIYNKTDLIDPTNFSLILFKKKKLNFYFLNPEFIRLGFKTCFSFIKKNIKLKNPFIFFYEIKNPQLKEFITFYFLKKNIFCVEYVNDSSFREYKKYLKKKNIIVVSLFLSQDKFLTLQNLTTALNVPLVSFSNLQVSKYAATLSIMGSFAFDYVQFLVLLTLIILYEKI